MREPVTTISSTALFAGVDAGSACCPSAAPLASIVRSDAPHEKADFVIVIRSPLLERDRCCSADTDAGCGLYFVRSVRTGTFVSSGGATLGCCARCLVTSATL